MISTIISRLVILLFGTLYPAYASYKAVKTKNVKEYVKWMMYWIVFAFFTCIETFTDIFLSWFPFYYEIKVILVIWLLSPATKGSSTLYRKFVHPVLTRREQEIDEYISQAKEKGYTAVLQLGSKGVNYATNVIMQTAIKAFNKSQIDLALMPPPQNGYARDVHDGPMPAYQMHRSYSMDSALNGDTPNGYNNNIIYEVESEAEAQDFLMGECESDLDAGSSAARARVVTRRKTQPRRAAAAAATKVKAAPRARRAIHKESVDVDVVNDD